MIIDCDTHFFPKNAFAFLEGELASKAPRLKLDEAGHLADIEFPGAPPRVPGSTPLPAPGSGARYDGNNDMAVRLADYDRLGIDKQLILPQFTAWWSYLVDPALGSALAHSWNLSILELMDAHPEEVHGVALVALQDVEGFIREMEWAADQGFVAVVLDHTYPVREHPYGTPLATHREAWPFFARCEEMDMPIFLHAVQHGHRIVNLLNFQRDGLDFFSPTEAQMNLVAMITTGLLDAHPELRIIHAEMGTKHIKPLAQRLDNRYKRVKPDYEDDEGVSPVMRRKPTLRPELQLVTPEEAVEKNAQTPSHYFRKNFYWTIETEEPELAEAIAFVGADRFLFATDYPHDDPGGAMKFKDVQLLASSDLFTEEEKEMMRWKNAVNLFKLGERVGAR